MSLAPSPSLRRRLLVLCLSLFLFAALLMTRYGMLQIHQKDYWSDKADRQHFLSIQEPFIRGTLYSHPSLHPGHPNQAHTLAWDIPKWNLCADPQVLPALYHAEIAQSLALRLCLPPSHKRHLLAQLSKKSRHRKLVVALSSSTKAQLLSWWIPFARARQHSPKWTLLHRGLPAHAPLRQLSRDKFCRRSITAAMKQRGKPRLPVDSNSPSTASYVDKKAYARLMRSPKAPSGNQPAT